MALKTNAYATAAELRHLLPRAAGELQGPRKVLFRESLPRSGTGKVLKRLLRKELDLEGAQ